MQDKPASTLDRTGRTWTPVTEKEHAKVAFDLSLHYRVVAGPGEG